MGLFNTLIKTAVHIVTAPIEIIKDTATLGGTLTDEGESYTLKRLKKLLKDSEEINEEIDEL